MSDVPRLLIIDDEEIVIKSCHKVLQKSGYAIDEAHSGEDGLRQAASNRYDVIVTDLKMPGIDGLEVLKRLKAAKPEQVVVVFTGYANVSTARESLKLGAFDYVPKPFTAGELRDVIANAVKSAATRSVTPMLDLMAIVAHEFKSPVATVHTTVETLYRGYFGHLTPEQQHSLETVMRNCQYLEDIIRSYVDLTRMELNNLEFRPQEVDLVREVVEPVVGTPEYQENFKKMRLVSHYDEVPKVMGDANLLKIVVNNLVNNAIKYGAPGTDMRVEVSKHNGRVTLSVFNEGAGIPRADISTRLFTRFGRLKQKGTEGVKGSGLGLYICKQIVDKHRGTIEVSSEVGKFARFAVELDCAAPGTESSRADAGDSAPR
jgi:two-component system, sensor histidine kinase and response regulator